MDFKVKEKTSLYDDGRFHLNRYVVKHDRFDGGEEDDVVRVVFERRPCVSIIAYDKSTDSLVLVEQFRIGKVHTDAPWSSELPAGIIDEGETPEMAAKRECVEETGAEPRALKKITSYYPSSGGSSEEMHLFFAEVNLDQVKALAGLKDEKEDIRTHIVTLGEAKSMIDSGAITSGHTIIGILALLSGMTA